MRTQDLKLFVKMHEYQLKAKINAAQAHRLRAQLEHAGDGKTEVHHGVSGHGTFADAAYLHWVRSGAKRGGSGVRLTPVKHRY